MILIMIQGLAMALADSVPGVSGGTIAFIMGFYEQLITALRHLFATDRTLRKEAFFYLLKFAIGWCAGMGASILVLSHIFEKNIYFLSSLFLGLTIGAIPFIIYEEWNTLKGKYLNLIFTLIGISAVVMLTAFRGNFIGMEAINFSQLDVFQYVYLIFSGLFAVVAMLMPGVSGSTMLLILGVYVPTVYAVKELLHLQLQYLPGVTALFVGMLAGIIFGTKIIRTGLTKFRTQMLYLILGLLLGSIYAIIMGPATLDIPRTPMDIQSFNLAAFIMGISILGSLEFTKYKTSK